MNKGAAVTPVNIARKSPVASRPDVRAPDVAHFHREWSEKRGLAAMDGMSGPRIVPQAKKPMTWAVMTRKAAHDGERHALEQAGLLHSEAGWRTLRRATTRWGWRRTRSS